MIDTWDQHLTAYARSVLNDAKAIAAFRQEYRRIGILQIENFADRAKLSTLGEVLRRELLPFYSTQNGVRPPRLLTVEGGTSRMYVGYKVSCLDPTVPHLFATPEEQLALTAKFAELGLVDLGEHLARVIEPLLKAILEKPVAYQHFFCLVYQEGDYIGPHDDAAMGDRVNVQFPITFAAATGFRALKDEAWELYYDTPGSVRILGPNVWHEVLPVLRLDQQQEALRLILSLRFR